jgi:ATP-dependent protease ClpP protease subunit
MNTLFKLHLDNLARAKQPVNLVKNDSEATLYIYDVISADWGVSALSVIDAIAQAGDTKALKVRISSPGGDVFESRAIMAAIARFPGSTTAHIDGVCASAATSIALACGEVVMNDGGFFMIHNASGMAWGDKQALRDTADLLEKVEGVIVADYTGKTGKDAAEIMAMMEAETWMTADQALEHGFIDRIESGKAKPGNTWNLSAFSKAPPLPANETPPEPAPAAGFFMSDANANRLRLLEI